MDIKRWKRECQAKKLVEVLNAKHFNAQYAETADAAREAALALIPAGATVGVGGSETLAETGVLAALQSGKYKFIDRYHCKDWDDTLDKYRQALLADAFVSSVNAVTKAGELACVDCTGNRVAALHFGPKKVVIVVGVNKIVEDLDAAFKRLKEIAPMNVRRNNHQTPCAETGECADCMTQGRMCTHYGVISNEVKFGGRIHIIVVPEVLGF
jgi:L-lactate utilization protein LutB